MTRRKRRNFPSTTTENGAYFHVGMADPDRPITSSPHHNCSFQLDERGLAIALEMELALYLKLTKQDGE